MMMRIGNVQNLTLLDNFLCNDEQNLVMCNTHIMYYTLQMKVETYLYKPIHN